MESESAPSSRASIISIDPAVASQITGTSQATSIPGHSRTGSSPAKRTKESDTVTTRGHARNRSAPIPTQTKRSNSLRRAKNSTEVLRQRSSRSTRKPKQLDPITDTREGRNFTIGNVGTGGVLYLKPSAHQNASLQTSPPILMPLTAPADLPAISQNDENARPLMKDAPSSESPSAVVRSTSPKRSLAKSARRPTTETVRSRHGRSQSFSTLEQQRPSFTSTKSRTLKIVINRPDTAHPKASHDSDRDAPQLALPTLEVPIPHYRIGTPRFSDHGTAMLRSSAYTRTSVTPSEASRSDTTAQPKQQSSGPPPSSIRAFAKLGASHIGALGGNDRVAKSRPTTSESAKTDSTIREPIHPEIYDALAEVYDDPSVVRYSQNVREITAATPARIIAQISSESFMDYELVSDFFLTFRSYMTTYNVLDLLLARLHWAINRLEDDGRIIRVRTFAALRHWILNYFLDDFMVDRRLRVRICNGINRMYEEVASRASQGTSDLKVLRDLKRCWNGRCSMYWDPADFSLDGDQDADLHPGGFDEPEPVENPEVADEAPPLPEIRAKTYSNSSWFDIPPTLPSKTHHERQTPTAKQDSVGSEQSLQAKSCSIPKGLLRSNPDSVSPDGGSHPVPVQLQRKDAPSNLQVQTMGHRRGAASIDSDREPTPRNVSMASFQLLQGASIILGSVYSPSTPFVQILSSPTTSAISRFEPTHALANGTRRGGSPHSAHAPGVKTIFGSLRKALAGRHGHSDMALVTVSSPMPLQTKQPMQRSPLPLNMSKSHDELRSRAQPAPRKDQIRIDLLCAQVSQNFDVLFPHAKRVDPTSATAPPLDIRPAATGAPIDPALLTPDLRKDRLPSHTTAQSGSIVIVNDTGVSMPAMSGALQSQNSLHGQREASGSVPEDLQKLQFGLGIDNRRQSFAGAATQRSSDALGEAIASREIFHLQPEAMKAMKAEESAEPLPSEAIHAESADNMASTAGSTTTMRRRSYQSSAEADVPKPSVDATATSISAHHEQENDEAAADGTKMPTQSLRRRPGGDLRKVENVHDLDHAVHHESLDTITTGSGSPIHSFLVMNDSSDPARAKPRQTPPHKPVSMINTHSSQHLRPSFEAAVAGFSAIPDDDDGGFEVTLMKLEGRYEKMSPPLEQHPIDTAQRRRSMPEISTRPPLELNQFAAEAPDVPKGFAYMPSVDRNLAEENNRMVDNENGGSSRKSSIFGLPVGSADGSEDSFDPQPLLQRDTVSGPVSQPSMGKIIPSPLNLQKGFENASQFEGTANALHRHFESRPSSQRAPTAAESNQSFLLDEDENLSDLSSEISVDIINYTHAADRSISPMLAAPGTALSGLEIPSHPLTYASVVNLAPATERERDSTVMRESQHVQNHNGDQAGGGGTNGLMPPPNAARTPQGPAHIPFILACDSQLLAQQLTLIEKSALGEIEWSDLVDRRWSHATRKVLDWAEYLAKDDVRGVDLVVTRFNLVSNWVRSEIVLTQDIEERAQVITKYIHVAAHARRLHNYATMVQVTVGLTSSDCTRLTKTWEKVPSPDRSLLKNMERLVQPIRNFHELRLEVESADFSDGCIPFLGLYVRDLTYNAQKPAQVASKRGSEPLVNFERFRTAAVIVKNLLRLIDASARYSFEPVKGVIERCLWLATLPDDKIYTLSRSLEQ